jgi:hypothetical protein
MRFMTLYKPGKESDAPPTQEEMAKMGRLIEEMTRAGVRVTISDGKFTVVDGPFAETKELISGYAIIEAKSKEHAIELTKRFLEVVGEGQSEIRLMHGEPAFEAAPSAGPGEGEKRRRAEVGAKR